MKVVDLLTNNIRLYARAYGVLHRFYHTDGYYCHCVTHPALETSSAHLYLPGNNASRQPVIPVIT